MKLVTDTPPSPDADDAMVQQALAAHYAPPGDSSYWSRLESRIMSGVRADAAREWWSYFPGWVRYGVVAAAAAALIAAIASWQARATQDHMAYREILDADSEVLLLSERMAPADRDRNQTLRYLLTR
jgi:anti-sigma-K factor RskA